MENQNHNTVMVYTYRYYWKTLKGKLCVKYVTGSLEEHVAFEKSIRENADIESAMREYVNQIDFAYLGFTEAIKEKKKEKEEFSDEEKSDVGQ